jgi:hypothetical protein
MSPYSLDYSSYVVEVFPNKASDAQVFCNCLEGAVWELISRRGAFDRNIVHKQDGEMGYFVLENESDIAMLDLDGICVSHRNGSESKSAERRLEGDEIARFR